MTSAKTRRRRSGRLASHHASELLRSGITYATARAAGIYSESRPEEIARLLDWKSGADSHLGNCLVFPFRNRAGGRNEHCRLKPDCQRRGKGKYEAPLGQPVRVYFPPSTIAALSDPTAPLLVTEGEKKSLAADQAGFPCVGICGVDAWSKKRDRDKNGKPRGRRELLDDLATIPWQGRKVYIVFDSDVLEKPRVQEAERELAKALTTKGADVKCARLSPGPNGEKVGLDDFLLAHSLRALRALLKKAEAPKKVIVKQSKPRKPVAVVEPPAGFADSDLGNAERFITAHRDTVRFCHEWGAWFVWNGARWERDTAERIIFMASQVARGIYGEAQDADDADRRKALALHALHTERRERLVSMLALARTLPGVSIKAAELDADPWLLGCENGTLDLRTGRLREPDPADFITKSVRAKYAPRATCPRWLRVVSRALGANRATIRYLQKWAGYALTGNVTEQVFLNLWGRGANSKSTIVGALLDVWGSDYAIEAPPDLLLSNRSDAHPTAFADLCGIRLAAAIETDEGRRLAESWVKQLTGGDRIRARRMRENYFEFRPTHKIVLSTNHRPEIRGTDWAMWRRVRLVPFTVTIPDPEQDKELPVKLRLEADGILAWAVRGCRLWQKEGLAPPEKITTATTEYRVTSDLIGQFIEERCVTKAGEKERASNLYFHYSTWAEDAGEKALTQNRFGAALSERGFIRATSNGVIYKGLTLKKSLKQVIKEEK